MSEICFNDLLDIINSIGRLPLKKEIKNNFKIKKFNNELKNKALILDYDQTLRFSVGEQDWPEKIDDIKIFPNRKEKIQEYLKLNYLILGASNQSVVSRGLDKKKCIECFNHTNNLLECDIDYIFCPHSRDEIECFCRKPLPGIGAILTVKYHLDPSQCIMIGDKPSDEEFAKNCGFQYQHPTDFFINYY